MNVIAGILIGIVNDSWFAIILASLIWAIVWCIYQFIHKDKFESYIARVKEKNIPPKWGMSYAQSFYFIEYLTASITALIFSVLAQSIKVLFFI